MSNTRTHTHTHTHTEHTQRERTKPLIGSRAVAMGVSASPLLVRPQIRIECSLSLSIPPLSWQQTGSGAGGGEVVVVAATEERKKRSFHFPEDESSANTRPAHFCLQYKMASCIHTHTEHTHKHTEHTAFYIFIPLFIQTCHFNNHLSVRD